MTHRVRESALTHRVRKSGSWVCSCVWHQLDDVLMTFWVHIEMNSWVRESAYMRQITPYCNRSQQIATCFNRLQHVSTDCNRLQQIATDCNRLLIGLVILILTTHSVRGSAYMCNMRFTIKCYFSTLSRPKCMTWVESEMTRWVRGSADMCDMSYTIKCYFSTLSRRSLLICVTWVDF